MTQFVPSYEVNEAMKVLCVSVSVPVPLSICLPLLGRPFTLTEKFVCGKINIVLSVIRIITILVKLMPMIWRYVSIFLVFQSFALSLSLCF